MFSGPWGSWRRTRICRSLFCRGLRVFDFRGHLNSVWPEALRPIGNDTFEKEPFEVWWRRHKGKLEHLPEQLVEQWIFRHFDQTQFSFIPIETMETEKLSLSPQDILKLVHRELAHPLEPTFDKAVFEKKIDGRMHPTGDAFERLGTWDYPIVVVSTPNGLISPRIPNGDNQVRFLLVEGHQRHRYFNALYQLHEAPAGLHEMLVVHTPITH